MKKRKRKKNRKSKEKEKLRRKRITDCALTFYVDGLIAGAREGGGMAYKWGSGTVYERKFTVWFVSAPVSRLFFRVETSSGRKMF